MSDDKNSGDAVEFKPLVSFEDQSHSYVHGFEAGILWQKMQERPEWIKSELPYHNENYQTILRMATASGYIAHTDGVVIDGWVDFVFELAAPEKPKPKLSLVSA